MNDLLKKFGLVYNKADDGAGGGTGDGDPPAGDAGDPPGGGEGDPPAGGEGGDGDPPPTPPGDGGSGDPPEPANPFAELDEDTRNWLEKRDVKTPADVAKLAREQASLLGDAIRRPGKDASDEDREAFLNKLGRPEQSEGYEFEVPKDLPEDLPYDAERASAFKEVSHKIGLTQDQASALHDWFAGQTVEDFTGTSERAAEQRKEIARQETEKLTNRWGPMDGETAKANLAYADTAIRELGGEEAVESLKKWGLISEDNLIQDETMAVMFANVGMSLFKEDDVLRGDIKFAGNPFEEGTEHFNVTAQHRIAKADPDKARNLIRAAGGDPADHGL